MRALFCDRDQMPPAGKFGDVAQMRAPARAYHRRYWCQRGRIRYRGGSEDRHEHAPVPAALQCMENTRWRKNRAQGFYRVWSESAPDSADWLQSEWRLHAITHVH